MKQKRTFQTILSVLPDRSPETSTDLNRRMSSDSDLADACLTYPMGRGAGHGRAAGPGACGRTKTGCRARDDGPKVTLEFDLGHLSLFGGSGRDEG